MTDTEQGDVEKVARIGNAVLEAATNDLARRSLPSPEAGGDEFERETGKHRPPHKPAGTRRGVAQRLALLANDIERYDLFQGTRSAEAAEDLRTALGFFNAAPEAGGVMAEARWPFVETPGNFADRLAAALDVFQGDMLAAVRFVLIEDPAHIAPKAAPDAGRAIAEAREASRAIIMEVALDVRLALAASKLFIRLADLAERQASDLSTKDAAVERLSVELDWALNLLGRRGDCIKERDAENARLRGAISEAVDLLAERVQGSSARSAGHNARLLLESAL